MLCSTLEGLEVRGSSDASHEFTRGSASFGDSLDGEAVRDGKGGCVGFRQNLDSGWRRHGSGSSYEGREKGKEEERRARAI